MHWTDNGIIVLMILNFFLIVCAACAGYYFTVQDLFWATWSGVITGFLYSFVLLVILGSR